jgi:hypothetical protein
MSTIFNSEWVTDVEKMTCRNKTNNIVILFKKINGSLIGEIKTLPMKVVSKWAAEGLVNKRIKNAATEAQVIFLNAYFEKKSIRMN